VNANNVYFHYDATLNPNFPSAAVMSAISITGQGRISKGQYNNGLYLGTVLDFGTQQMIVGTGSGTSLIAARFSELTMISNNATGVLRFRKVAHGAGWSNLMVVQKGAGDGVEMDDCFYITVSGNSIIYASTQAGVGTGRGFYCHNSSQAAGEYHIEGLTVDSFGIGRLFGEAASGASAQNTVHSLGCQSIACGEGLVIGRGVKASTFDSEHIETCKVVGIRCYQSCQTITFTNPYFYNPAATEADVVLGKTAATDSDNAWKNIFFINPLFIAIKTTGISVIVTSNARDFHLHGGSFSAETAGVGIGIDFHGTICRGATLDHPHFATSFATEITDLANVEYYRASGSLGTTTYRAPVDLGQLVRLTGVITPASFGGAQNNYNPTNFATASIVRLTATGASRNVTGMVPVGDGDMKILQNIGGQDIVLTDEDGASTDVNRYALKASVTLNPDGSATLRYDGTSLRWRMCGGVH
jgi:hypothetical protein